MPPGCVATMHDGYHSCLRTVPFRVPSPVHALQNGRFFFNATRRCLTKFLRFSSISLQSLSVCTTITLQPTFKLCRKHNTHRVQRFFRTSTINQQQCNGARHTNATIKIHPTGTGQRTLLFVLYKHYTHRAGMSCTVNFKLQTSKNNTPLQTIAFQWYRLRYFRGLLRERKNTQKLLLTTV